MKLQPKVTLPMVSLIGLHIMEEKMLEKLQYFI